VTPRPAQRQAETWFLTSNEVSCGGAVNPPSLPACIRGIRVPLRKFSQLCFESWIGQGRRRAAPSSAIQQRHRFHDVLLRDDDRRDIVRSHAHGWRTARRSPVRHDVRAGPARLTNAARSEIHQTGGSKADVRAVSDRPAQAVWIHTEACVGPCRRSRSGSWQRRSPPAPCRYSCQTASRSLPVRAAHSCSARVSNSCFRSPLV